VRRNPVSDYRFPRTSLIRGDRARAMLRRNLPGAIEDLPIGFFSTCVDIIGARPVHHRRGQLAVAVGASMAVPMFVEPVVYESMLLLDGGLMDNLPSEAMAMDGEGPVIAVDVSEPSVRSLPDGVQPTVPSFTETMFKVMLLNESDDARRRSFADLLIRPDFEGVGILEFHMIDPLRDAGRRAAAEALEHAPDSIFD
jgi:predicted acylesterase/phospholipase RssA